MYEATDNTGGSATIIEVLGAIQPGPGRWQPHVGNETLSLTLSLALPDQSRSTIIQEAVNVLSRCVPPTELEGQETGLVVGYVQSGKTMSFTTVAALARDNGYRIIIIVAGTSKYLLDQSRNRLINDLRLNSRIERRPWRHVPDPTLARNSHLAIRDVLEEWNDPAIPSIERRSVLVTVMKHHKHLQNLIAVVRYVDLQGIPVLIIDDEGDQAGLNTRVRQGAQSTTYRRLLSLKGTIPHHSFLQYTATPQAPLLINLVDVLSPSFAEVITPGEGYTGGREFFTSDENLVRVIPPSEIPTANNPLNAPPVSLLQAMRLFLLGAAVHMVSNDPDPNRSMMVHPSQLTARHGQYASWVTRAREGWLPILALPTSDRDFIDLIDLFRQDYNDLQSTMPNIPPFDVLTQRLRPALLRTMVREVNSVPGRSDPINWSETPYWILVGGQAMDRGFTVEGLTITYMPRGPGVGNADTIQQRARFFGYKQRYRGYCRIFLEPAVNDAFIAYVEHEEDIRTQLIEHRETGRPMSEWRRQFFLTRNLRPTREDVIDVGYRRVILADDWVYPEGPHDSMEAIQANQVIFQNFRSMVNFEPYDGPDRRDTDYRNLVAHDVPLSQVHEELLTRIRIRRLEDSILFTALLRLIQVHLQNNPNDTCTVFLMASGNLIRRGYENDRIKELFQGIQYDRQGVTYPGDRQVRADVGISLQLRYLTLGERNQAPIAENIPHAAVWIPASIAPDLIQQPQGG